MCRNRRNLGTFPFLPNTMRSKNPKRLLPKVSETFTDLLQDSYRKSLSLLPKVSETFTDSLGGYKSISQSYSSITCSSNLPSRLMVKQRAYSNSGRRVRRCD